LSSSMHPAKAFLSLSKSVCIAILVLVFPSACTLVLCGCWSRIIMLSPYSRISLNIASVMSSGLVYTEPRTNEKLVFFEAGFFIRLITLLQKTFQRKEVDYIERRF
jgi:hypothetical protein